MKGTLLDENGETIIVPVRDANGLIISGEVIDNVDYQCCKMIIVAQKGEFKEYPTLGFGIDNWLKKANPNVQQFKNELQKELKSDCFKNAKVIVKDNNLLNFDVEI